MIIDDNVAKNVFINSQKGYGMIFQRDLRAEDVQFSERPLLSFLHFYSRNCSLICDYCYKGIGSLSDNIDHVLRINKRSIDLKIKEILSNTYFTNHSHDHAYIKCPFNCDTVYCSRDCLELSKGSHRLLCSDMDECEREKWSLFKRHSIKHHENFYFSGLVYVRIITDAMDGKPIKEWIDKLSEFYSKRWDLLEPPVEVANSVLKPRLELATESFQLLRDALKRFEETLDDLHKEILFSIDFYLSLLGTMDLVCVDIEIPNPLNRVLLDLYNTNYKVVEALLGELRNVVEIIRGESVSTDSVKECIKSMELFPDIIGLGIFDNLSKMNHSCQPSVEIDYEDNNIAKINLLCDVSVGQEATISYIDENDDFETRRRKLGMNYGFQCGCGKCLEEESQLAKPDL